MNQTDKAKTLRDWISSDSNIYTSSAVMWRKNILNWCAWHGKMSISRQWTENSGTSGLPSLIVSLTT